MATDNRVLGLHTVKQNMHEVATDGVRIPSDMVETPIDSYWDRRFTETFGPRHLDDTFMTASWIIIQKKRSSYASVGNTVK
jgi:hypothetical protein